MVASKSKIEVEIAVLTENAKNNLLDLVDVVDRFSDKAQSIDTVIGNSGNSIADITKGGTPTGSTPQPKVDSSNTFTAGFDEYEAFIGEAGDVIFESVDKSLDKIKDTLDASEFKSAIEDAGETITDPFDDLLKRIEEASHSYLERSSAEGSTDVQPTPFADVSTVEEQTETNKTPEPKKSPEDIISKLPLDPSASIADDIAKFKECLSIFGDTAKVAWKQLCSNVTKTTKSTGDVVATTSGKTINAISSGTKNVFSVVTKMFKTLPGLVGNVGKGLFKALSAPTKVFAKTATAVADIAIDKFRSIKDAVSGVFEDFMSGIVMGAGINFSANPLTWLSTMQGFGSDRLDRAKEKREGTAEIEKQKDLLRKTDAAIYGEGNITFDTQLQIDELDKQLRDLQYQYRDVSDAESEQEDKLSDLQLGWESMQDTLGSFMLSMTAELIPIFQEVQAYLMEYLPKGLAFVEACLKNPIDAITMVGSAVELTCETAKGVFVYAFCDYIPKLIQESVRFIWDGFTKFDWWKVLKGWLAYFAEFFVELNLMFMSAGNAIIRAALELGKQIWESIQFWKKDKKGGGFDLGKIADKALEGFNDVENMDAVKSVRASLKKAREEGSQPAQFGEFNLPTWERQKSKKEIEAQEKFSQSVGKITGSDDYKKATDKWTETLEKFQTFNIEEKHKKNREFGSEDKTLLRREKSQQAAFEDASSTWFRIATSIQNKIPPDVKELQDIKKKNDENHKESIDVAKKQEENSSAILEVTKSLKEGVTKFLEKSGTFA